MVALKAFGLWLIILAFAVANGPSSGPWFFTKDQIDK
jgi:hypothetical protein